MKFLKLFSLLILVLSLSVFITSAQEDNDPATNPDANACNEGGSMAGDCNSDSNGDGVVTQEEIDWAWNCGWYLIRYEHQMISAANFPSDCSILLSYIPDPLCYLGVHWLSGTPNSTLLFFPAGCWNGQGYDYSVVLGFPAVLVVAGSYEEAVATCKAFFDTDLVVVSHAEGNYWGCGDLS